jgi:GDP/UDP-N,N'-diacetylbacillosamine 2-epimerase (hydrolysing)
MTLIRQEDRLDLQLLVTGAHLSKIFGNTIDEIEADGFTIDRRVDIQLGAGAALDIARSMGLAMTGVAEALSELKPDIMLVLGDRYEILSAVTAALILRVPVAHLHGGEVTSGAIDDAMRHAITKMAYWHFTAHEAYRQRVIQLGEAPDRVHAVGGLGVDAIVHARLLDRAELEESLGIRLRARNLLVTFHPATWEGEAPSSQMAELLAALSKYEDLGLIFTFPNADEGGRELIDLILQYVAAHPNAHAYATLGSQRYLSCLRHCSGIIGNSSSGLLEAPSFRIGTINIGSRQDGRLQAGSVINCAPRKADIEAAMQTLFSPNFQAGLAETKNPYGDGGAGRRIVDVLKTVSLEAKGRKTFFDLPVEYRGRVG